jgi:hypothetical protein
VARAREVIIMRTERLNELLYEALETEHGGVQIYRTALRCVQNEELREEWQKYLDETENHERILLEVFEAMGLDPVIDTPGRRVVRHIGQSLVAAMEMALENGEPEAAERVAAECIVLAETKDHLNWELLGECGGRVKGESGKVLREAHEKIEDQEDEHLYHTTGWTRELWIKALGMPAVLPPPEEEKDVKTAVGAARAKKSRKKML